MPKTCFVIGPIGEEGTPTRQRSDALLDYIIRKVLEVPPFEMTVDRADDIQRPGLITSQVIERVVNADLAVADLTDNNPNAFYELALRHATRRPVVHMIVRGQTIPFDVINQRAIRYDTTDLGLAERAKEELRSHVEAALKATEPGDNPISAGLAVLQLAKSQRSTDQVLAGILNEISSLREEMAALGKPAPDTGKSAMSRLRAAMEGAEIGNRALANMGLGRNIDPETLKQLGRIGSLMSVDPETLKQMGRYGSLLNPGLTCANCGQPIGNGVPGRRSSDGAPIHLGSCPPGSTPPTATPST